MGDSLLHEWQVEVLKLERVLHGRNVVYCAPTSGGKSLVAEILALRRIHSTNKPAMLVLPFVSLCDEKAQHWERLLDSVNLKVRMRLPTCCCAAFRRAAGTANHARCTLGDWHTLVAGGWWLTARIDMSICAGFATVLWTRPHDCEDP